MEKRSIGHRRSKISEFFSKGSKDGTLKNGLVLVIKNQLAILLKEKRMGNF